VSAIQELDALTLAIEQAGALQQAHAEQLDRELAELARLADDAEATLREGLAAEGVLVARVCLRCRETVPAGHACFEVNAAE
jgi:hypothetical protein